MIVSTTAVVAVDSSCVRRSIGNDKAVIALGSLGTVILSAEEAVTIGSSLVALGNEIMAQPD